MKRERPWLQAKPTERLLDHLRIAVLQGDGTFGRSLADELQERLAGMTVEEAVELEGLKQCLARIED